MFFYPKSFETRFWFFCVPKKNIMPHLKFLYLFELLLQILNSSPRKNNFISEIVRAEDSVQYNLYIIGDMVV